MGFGTSHFAGGANLQPDQASGPDLAQILIALKNDVVSVAGIAGLVNIAATDVTIVSAADASDLSTLIALATQLRTSYNQLVTLLNEAKAKLDPLNQIVISAANAVATAIAVPIDLPTSLTLINDIKAKYNVLYLLGNELKADLNTQGTISIAAADLVIEATANATDQTTAQTLANAEKVKLNASRTLANEIKTDFNAVPKVPLLVLSL